MHANTFHRPRRPLFALMAVFTLFVLLSQLSACAWLDDKQNQLALRPTPGRPAGLAPDSELFKPGDERWLAGVAPVTASRGAGEQQQLALWWLPHTDAQAPALLYLHGTFRNLYGNLSKINALREAGFAVLAVDYRGWGDSTPITPDEDSITADAATAWAELKRRQPRAAQRVIYGHSMGGAVAVRLASGLKAQQDYGALVLESTFTRMPEVAKAAGVVGHIAAWLTTLQFDSQSRMPSVDAPVLMLHGSADKTVAVELGRKLRDSALKRPSKASVQWVEIQGGSHSRLHEEASVLYQATFNRLIQQLGNPSP
jgi:uncharacterized protein